MHTLRLKTFPAAVCTNLNTHTFMQKRRNTCSCINTCRYTHTLLAALTHSEKNAHTCSCMYSIRYKHTLHACQRSNTHNSSMQIVKKTAIFSCMHILRSTHLHLQAHTYRLQNTCWNTHTSMCAYYTIIRNAHNLFVKCTRSV